MKLGSLFDGSGGFPLAGSLCGIEPVWAAEVEPYPIAVTKSRFPKMKHLGNICNINGAEIEPVDIITFGSPCQDLSVAGKRAGLKHEDNGDDETTRSGLFMEAVRIIKEMRSATNGRYPTFALWENVPGAFSSNQGEDFRIVLEELIQIVEPTAKVPPVPKGGWAYSDIYLGDGWSLAYRVFDAQYWGVSQRRRRIHLVVDFRGGRAGEVLFKSEGLCGYFAEGRTPWQGVAGDASDRPGATDREGYSLTYGFPLGFRPENTNVYEGLATTICNGTRPGFTCGVIEIAVKQQHLFENHSQDTRYKGPLDICPMLPAQLGTGGNNTPFVVEQSVVYAVDQGGGKSGANVSEGVSPTLTCTHGGEPAVANCIGNGQADQTKLSEKVGTLDCMHDQKAVLVAIDRAFFNQGQNSQYEPQCYSDGTVPTLVAKGPSAVCHKQEVRYIVRRLTPTECARLQGFPDKWGHPDPKTELTDEEYAFWCKVNLDLAIIGGTARPNDNGWYNIWREVKPDKNKGEDFDPYFEDTGKPYDHKSQDQMLKWYNKLHTDSAEYKMWGNGIALPPALFCMQGIAQALEVGT